MQYHQNMILPNGSSYSSCIQPAEDATYVVLMYACMDFHELLEIPQGERRRYHDDVSIEASNWSAFYSTHHCDALETFKPMINKPNCNNNIGIQSIQYPYRCRICLQRSVLLRKKTNIDLMATNFQNLVYRRCISGVLFFSVSARVN